MTRRRTIVAFVLALLVSAAMLSMSAIAQRRGGGPPPPSKPTPHWPDGRVNLGPPPGDKGLWTPGGIVQLSLNPKSVNRASPNSHLPDNITLEAVPFQPWARALHAARQATFERDEPHTRCKASGGPREFITPYGVEFVDMPETKRIYIFDVGGPHTFRTIYMDGREHPKGLEPSEATVDDPGAYTAVWTGGFIMRWSPGTEPWEYICQDNNRSPQGMVGADASVSRQRRIIPRRGDGRWRAWCSLASCRRSARWPAVRKGILSSVPDTATGARRRSSAMTSRSS